MDGKEGGYPAAFIDDGRALWFGIDSLVPVASVEGVDLTCHDDKDDSDMEILVAVPPLPSSPLAAIFTAGKKAVKLAKTVGKAVSHVGSTPSITCEFPHPRP